VDKETYGMLTEIRDIVIETRTKVGTLCEHDADHEKRIRKIEDKPAQTLQKGKLTLLVALITVAVNSAGNAIWTFIIGK
jgi:hypothetical protein